MFMCRCLDMLSDTLRRMLEAVGRSTSFLASDKYCNMCPTQCTDSPTGMLDLLQHIREANTTLKGDLAFANDWQYFSQGMAD